MARKSAAAKSAEPDEHQLELVYNLGELPSSQHRAGLAGLVLMVRWLERLKPRPDALCRISALGPHSASFTLNRAGVAWLFDEVYAATTQEIVQSQARKDKNGEVVPPVREIETTEIDAKGKEKTKKGYVYTTVVPKGAFIADWDPAGAGKDALWAKLWRDMVWNIFRGVPATRAPFEARADGGQYAEDADEAWHELLSPDKSTELPSTYYLGAQAATADNVAFRDRGRFMFLLHFWPFVAQIYVPRGTDVDGSSRFTANSYAIAIPDVANLEWFCDALPEEQRGRDIKKVGYRPSGSVVDLPAESALSFLTRLQGEISRKEGTRDVRDLVLAVDVVHTERQGNNVRVLGASRVEPNEEQIGTYRRLQNAYWDPGFRRARLENLWHGRPWYAGMGRHMSTKPRAHCIDSKTFKHDALAAFSDVEVSMAESDGEAAKTVEELVYRMITRYIYGRLKTKHGLEWSAMKDNDEKERYSRDREKIAKDAFLSVRSRTGADFVHYFSNTLCSVPQRLDEAAYMQLTRALLTDTETIRTLTLLALSARA